MSTFWKKMSWLKTENTWTNTLLSTYTLKVLDGKFFEFIKFQILFEIKSNQSLLIFNSKTITAIANNWMVFVGKVSEGDEIEWPQHIGTK